MNPVISHALIGLACLVLGVCVGFSLRDRTNFKYQLVQNISVVVMSLLAMAGLFVAINETQAQAECQSVYNEQFSNAISEHTSAADKDRTALQIALTAILDPNATPETRLKAIQEWKRFVDEANKQRLDNPIPLPPGCVKDI